MINPEIVKGFSALKIEQLAEEEMNYDRQKCVCLSKRQLDNTRNIGEVRPFRF